MVSFMRHIGAFALLFISQAHPTYGFAEFNANRLNQCKNQLDLDNCGSSWTTGSAIRMSKKESISDTDNQKVFRVLALHGSEGNAEEFATRFEVLQARLAKENCKLEITALDAPFTKGNGFAWWNMPPGIRSFTADSYTGFETSATEVLDLWESEQNPPFDLILGHSQGAILVAALLALGRIPYHPPNGYVLNGVAWPNPYSEQLEMLDVRKVEPKPPRVLFLIGENDKITPNSTGERLRDRFKLANFQVSTIKHPGGHSIPNRADETMEAIAQWLLGDS